MHTKEFFSFQNNLNLNTTSNEQSYIFLQTTNAFNNENDHLRTLPDASRHFNQSPNFQRVSYDQHNKLDMKKKTNQLRHNPTNMLSLNRKRFDHNKFDNTTINNNDVAVDRTPGKCSQTLKFTSNRTRSHGLNTNDTFLLINSNNHNPALHHINQFNVNTYESPKVKNTNFKSKSEIKKNLLVY
jgi:hypothetical protein